MVGRDLAKLKRAARQILGNESGAAVRATEDPAFLYGTGTPPSASHKSSCGPSARAWAGERLGRYSLALA